MDYYYPPTYYQPTYQPQAMVPNQSVYTIFNPYTQKDYEDMARLNNKKTIWDIQPKDLLFDGCPHLDKFGNSTAVPIGAGTYNPDGDRQEVRMRCNLCGEEWNQINTETAPANEIDVIENRNLDYINTFKSSNVSINSSDIMRNGIGNMVTLNKRFPETWHNNINSIIGMEKAASYVPSSGVFGMNPGARVANLMTPPVYQQPQYVQQPVYQQPMPQMNPLMAQPVYSMPPQQFVQPAQAVQGFALNPQGAAQPVQQMPQQYVPVQQPVMAQPMQMVNTNMPQQFVQPAQQTVQVQPAQAQPVQQAQPTQHQYISTAELIRANSEPKPEVKAEFSK